jgi:ribosomal protein S12 methylthiotransferase accessory factor
MLWTHGNWLDTGEPVWLPASAVYLNATLEAEEALCQGTSNGLAAGTSVDEAASHAALELYERSKFIGAWLTHQAGWCYELADLDTEYACIVQQARARGAEIEVYLFSTDPFVAACIARGDGRCWPGVTLGLGAGSSEREAVGKAILEHGQTGPYFARIWRNRERPIPASPESIKSFQDHALYYCDPSHAKEFDFLRSGQTSSLLAITDVRIAIADLTPPDLLDSPFRVVRALALGLQPIHYGHGLERVLVPQLQAALAGRAPNCAPIPIC